MGQVLHGSATTTHAIRALIQPSCASNAALSRELGINVNAIAPGVVDGEHWKHVDALFAKLENMKPGEKNAEVVESVPIGRFATPEDLTGMAAYLASSDADYVVSQCYKVDGGQWMS